MQTEIKFQRGPMHWEVTIDGRWYVTKLPCTGKVAVKWGEVHKQYAAEFPNAKIGVKASDIGPVTAAVCSAHGHGNMLWMR